MWVAVVDCTAVRIDGFGRTQFRCGCDCRTDYRCSAQTLKFNVRLIVSLNTLANQLNSLLCREKHVLDHNPMGAGDQQLSNYFSAQRSCTGAFAESSGHRTAPTGPRSSGTDAFDPEHVDHCKENITSAGDSASRKTTAMQIISRLI